jgi:hypothetical protein
MIKIITGSEWSNQEGSLVVQMTLSSAFTSQLKQFTPTTWMVLTAIMFQVKQSNAVALSVREIREITGISETTIRDAIQTLCMVKIQDQRVLMKVTRKFDDGACNRNLYVIMPSQRDLTYFVGTSNSEGGTPNFEEGTSNSDDHISLLSVSKAELSNYIPPIVPHKSKRTVTMPKDDDPAAQMYRSYRQVMGFPIEFSQGEWQGVHLVLREMIRAGVTTDEVERRTRNLLTQWEKKQMVTVRALWKHWSSAGITKATGYDKASEISSAAIAALRNLNNH